MAINHTLIDLLRRGRSTHENHLIDGLVRGTVSRREFLRYGSVLGLSGPLLRSLTAAIGYSSSTAQVRAAPAGGTIRVAQIVPAATIDPVKIADSGGITVLS